MSTTIIFPERNVLKSQAMKYVVDKFGFYVKPEEPRYDKKEEVWHIDCSVSLTNYISNEGIEGKKFIYYFKRVGELLYKEIDGEFLLINRPIKKDIEKEVSDRYISLTNEIEKLLLNVGHNSWGKLSLTKNYLSPLYTMISNLIDKGYLLMSDIGTKKNYKFFTLLLNSDYIKIEPSEKTMFYISNKLEKIKEELYKKYDDISTIELTENIVGIVFGNYYDVIKSDFGIRPPTSYVDMTKSYYFDAIRYGDIIKVTDKDILHSLMYFDGSIRKYDSMNFRKSLLELVDASLLNKSNGYYFGTDEIYEELFSYRNKIISGVDEL